MPTFTSEGERHFVSYITGPSHIRLGLRFSASPVPSPEITCQPAIGASDHAAIDERLLLEAVAAGTAEASPLLTIAEVFYVADDSPRYSLYRHCAKLLAERFLQGRLCAQG
jgi:hypothetical protein